MCVICIIPAYMCVSVSVCVCVCNSLKVYTFMKETLFMYLYAEIEKKQQE